MEETNDLSALASLLKSFLHDLPIPLISQDLADKIYPIIVQADENDDVKTLLENHYSSRDKTKDLRVLKYVLQHLNRVASEANNKMNSYNLAVVFSPNLIFATSATTMAMTHKRGPSLFVENDVNVKVVDWLISNISTKLSKLGFDQ